MYSRCPLSLSSCFFLSRQSVVIIKVVLDQKHVVKSLWINDSVKTVAKVVKNTTKGRDRSLFNKNCFCSLFFRFFFQKVDDFHHGTDARRLLYSLGVCVWTE